MKFFQRVHVKISFLLKSVAIKDRQRKTSIYWLQLSLSKTYIVIFSGDLIGDLVSSSFAEMSLVVVFKDFF